MEFELLLLRKAADPRKTVYRTDEVDAVFEIKNNAVSDQTTKTKANFENARAVVVTDGGSREGTGVVQENEASHFEVHSKK